MEKNPHSVPDFLIEDEGEWLLLARKRLKLSQRELGEISGYSQSWLSKMEGGHVPLSQSLKELIIKLLKERDLYAE